MSVSSLSTLASLGAAVAQARLEAAQVGPSKADRRGAAPAAAPAPSVAPSSAAVRQAERLGQQMAQDLAAQQMALAQMQSNLRSLHVSSALPGRLLDLSA